MDGTSDVLTSQKEQLMTVVWTLDVHALTAKGYSAVGLEHEMAITNTPLHNAFASRLQRAPGPVPAIPGAPDVVSNPRALAER
jgi:hypothetical protein